MKTHTELNKGNIGSLLKRFLERHKGTLENLRKQHAREKYTLFEVKPDFSLIEKGLCGYCGKGLKVLQNGRGAYCGRKKCPAKPKFFIRISKLNELKR